MKVPGWVILLVFCSSCQQETKPVDLRFRLPAGKTWSVKTRIINSNISGANSISDTVMLEFNLVLQKADTTGDRLRMHITKLLSAKQPPKAGVVVNNSKNVAELNMNDFFINRDKVYQAIGNDTLFLVVNNAGVLIMEDGYDALISKLVTNTGVDKIIVRNAIHDYLGTAAMSDFFKGMFFYLPADDLEHRRSWVSNTVFNSMAPVKHSNMIKVDSINDSRVRLEVEAQVSAGEEGSRYRTGIKKGSLVVDRISGLILLLNLAEESTVTTPSATYQTRKKTSISGILQ